MDFYYLLQRDRRGRGSAGGGWGIQHIVRYSTVFVLRVQNVEDNIRDIPGRVSLRQHQKSESFTILRPYTPIKQFFPDVVLYKDFAEWKTYGRQPSPATGEKRRKVVRLETKKIPFSLLEDMRREMFHSEAAKIIEKGSNFVQALR